MKKLSLFQFCLSSLGCLFILSDTCIAQVNSDGTVDTQVNQNGNVAEITGGQTRGSNLFHSFQDFSVPTDNEAFFNNANNVSNIFSRVTGGNISNIDGAIRANGSANLFLINPAGIIFGENARLDVGGSFLASSSSSILFENGEFNTTDLTNQPLLIVNAPIGLGFRDDPGEIVNNSIANNGKGLTVNPGNNLSFLGGNVNFNGGIATAPGGTINLGGLSNAGTINLEPDSILNFSDDVAQSNILLSNNAKANITSDGGGLITINANNLELTGESLLLANIGKDLGSNNALAGTIKLNIFNLTVDDKSLIQTDNLGTGRAGTIDITTDNFSLTNGSAITATTFGIGDAGIINVTAQDIAIDREFSGIYSNVGLTNVASESLESNVANVTGNGGEININTNNLSLLNGARILSSSIAQGDGGVVNVNATGSVSYIGQGVTPIPALGGEANDVVISGAFSEVQQEGNGKAGEVNITADSLSLIDKGAVSTNNTGEGGDAGNIALNIANKIFLDREGLILAQVQSGAEGNGGDINIEAGSLEAQSNSLILADTRGRGDAGNINISIEDNITLGEASIILTEVGQGAVGDGGDINIAANSLIMQNASSITSQTSGLNNAGDINLEVGGDINLDNSNQIQSQTRGDAVGDAGNIAIEAGGSIFSTNGNLILADSQAIGNGGNITISAGQQIILEGSSEGGFPSQIVAGLSQENATGTGGEIAINASELILSDLAFISSNTVSGSEGAAGNITVNADRLSASQNGFINVFTANNFDGGEITINAQTVDLASGGKVLAATNGSGNAGNINLNLGDRLLVDNQVQSSTAFVDFGTGAQLLNDLQSEPSGLYADTTSDSTGDGGNINVGALDSRIPQEFIISNGGQIIADSKGTGNGGSIFLTSQTLLLNNNATISASTQSSTESGRSGVVTLNIADTLTLSNQSLISAQAFNDANGGNLNIDARFIIAFDGNNDILASAEDGIGGNIAIDTELLLGIEERDTNDSTNDINASSNFNLDGTVNINILSLDPIQGVTELPRNVVEPKDTIAQACKADRTTVDTNSFIVIGRGGVAPLPDAPLNSANLIVDGQVDNVSTISQAIATNNGKIQPARGIKLAQNGEIILTSYQTNNAGDRSIAVENNCGTNIEPKL